MCLQVCKGKRKSIQVKCHFFDVCLLANLAIRCRIRSPGQTKAKASWYKPYHAWNSLRHLVHYWNNVDGCDQTVCCHDSVVRNSLCEKYFPPTCHFFLFPELAQPWFKHELPRNLLILCFMGKEEEKRKNTNSRSLFLVLVQVLKWQR